MPFRPECRFVVAWGSERFVANSEVTPFGPNRSGHRSSPHPRIHPPVDHIRQQVHQYIGQPDRQKAALHQRIVAIGDGADGEAAEAGPTEDGFSDDGAGQQCAELEAHHGHYGDQGVGQGVAADDGGLAEALGAGGADVVLA